MDVFEKANDLILYIYNQGNQPGKSFKYDDIAVSFADNSSDSQEMLLIKYLLRDMLTDEFKYLTHSQNNLKFKISPSGYKHIHYILSERRDSNSIFCAMWFDKEMDLPWEKAFVPAIIESGHDPVRIDKEHFTGDVNLEMMKKINQSKLIIADFTQNRQNVYYEMGYAKGIKSKVVCTCEKLSFDAERTKPHFDVSHHQFILWERDNLNEFKNILSKRIQHITM